MNLIVALNCSQICLTNLSIFLLKQTLLHPTNYPFWAHVVVDCTFKLKSVWYSVSNRTFFFLYKKKYF